MSCSNAGWSAVTSAGANATLAGVLAGFMLNGVVVLLSRKMTKAGQVRALGLLLTAFVALGLDSYLFGLVTGDSSCHRAWTEAMLAAGLLGMGAVAIVAGFGLLVAEYVSEGDSESVTMLRTLFTFLRGGNRSTGPCTCRSGTRSPASSGPACSPGPRPGPGTSQTRW